MAGKRKCREEDELTTDSRDNTLTLSTSLENRISQPESKKARKRRRKAQRDALERNKLQSTDWLNNPVSLPPAAGPSQPAPPLQARLEAELQYSLEDMDFGDYGPLSPPTFGSDWVSSMVIAGEFPHCKKVKTSTKVSPHLAPRQLPAFPPSLPPPEVLPPIHIHPDLAVSTEAPAPTHPPQQALPLTIGMKPEQDHNSRHGIFHVSDSTREAGSRAEKRKIPYIPDPARTLVMEQLPKSHRSIDFVDRWCRSTSGVSALHLFVDPPSGKALIEFDTAELARKAWASPRLGQSLVGKKSNMLKGKPREDQIKVWWYRVDRGEVEEGEIEEGGVHPPSSPRKESKKDRKARLAKEREMKAMKENQRQQKKKQKSRESSSTLVPTLAQPAPSVVQATSSQVVPPAPGLPTAFLFDPSSSVCPPAQPWSYPSTQTAQVQLPTMSYFSPSSPSLRMGVGSSLAPGARGGHDDSASIASSGGRSSPEGHWSLQTAVVTPPSRIAVIATTVGQADDLPDYSEVDIDVDPTGGEVDSKTAPPSTNGKAQQPSTNDNALSPQPVIPAWPRFISESTREQPRSKQQSQAHPQPKSRTLATKHHSTVPMLISKNQSPQQNPLVSSSLTPISRVSNTSQHNSFSSIPSKSSPLVPTSASHGSNILSVEPKVAENITQSEHVGSNLDKQFSKSKMELVTAKNSTPPSSSPDPVSVPVFAATSSSGSNSVGQAMEENLRQLAFASKRARVSGVQPQSSSSQHRSSTSADVNMPVHNFAGMVLPSNDGPNHEQVEENNKAVSLNTIETSVTSSGRVPQTSTVDTFSFEDLAITFITQTIENVKANNNRHQPDPQASTLSSASVPHSTGAVVGYLPFSLDSVPSDAPAAGVNLNKEPLAINSSVNMSKSELSTKKRRLEKHLQESKILMERLSTAKTKREKDLLLKIMNEKMRCVSLCKTFFDAFLCVYRFTFIILLSAFCRTDG